MDDYKRYINVGVDCGDTGIAYYRIDQLQLSDYTHLLELKDVEEVKREVFETFVNQLLKSRNIRYKFEVSRDKNALRGVKFDLKEYGKKRGED